TDLVPAPTQATDQSLARPSLVETGAPASQTCDTTPDTPRATAPLAAAYPSYVWACDFVEDRDTHGKALHILTVMDEFTREGLDIEAARTTSAEQVISVLEQLVALHGAPAYLRSDNGPEFVALAVQVWLAKFYANNYSIL